MKFFKLSIILYFSILVISCETDNDFEKVTDISQTISTGTLEYVKRNDLKSENPEKHTLEFKMNTDFQIPYFEDLWELELFLKQNKEKINGNFVLLIDNTEVYYSEFIKGVEITPTKQRWNSLNSKNSYACNFDGLSKCTQDAIDNKSFFGKALCIAEGFTCVAIEFADCGWQNCGGEEFVQENIQ